MSYNDNTATLEKTQALTVLHTPDPDDAFAWWSIRMGKIEIPGYEFHVSSEHIQVINEACLHGEVDIAAISSAVFPMISDEYVMLSPGASVGRGYGPALAGIKNLTREQLNASTIAVPGDLTTGALLLKLFFPGAKTVSMPFDTIAKAIIDGDVDAGVLIHEELLNWKDKGMVKLLCLGQEWQKVTGLPIPVGLNVARKSLGQETLREIATAVHQSMIDAKANASEATLWAMNYSIATTTEIAENFISMFANHDTLRLADDCIKGLKKLYSWAYEEKLIDKIPVVDPVLPLERK